LRLGEYRTRVSEAEMVTVTSLKILLVEDHLAEARFLRELFKLSHEKMEFVHVQRLQEARSRLTQESFDVVLLDLTLPDSQGLSSVTTLKEQFPTLPIVVLTNTNDDSLALEAVRQGAQDYLVKRGVNGEILARSLRYAIERQHASDNLRQANAVLQTCVQAQTAQLAKAEKLNQFKTKFVSMLSHDCRNPLATILLSMGLLEGHAKNLSEEKKTSHFRQMRTAIHNVVQILDEASLVVKGDLENFPFQPILLDLEDFCRQYISTLQPTVQGNHRLVFNQEGELPISLWDETLLHHILSNLLSNAIKYSPDGGTITLHLIAHPETITLQIQDSGIGIPPEDQAQLFQAFHRATNVGFIQGTGLGLAIVKQCVKAHRGEITLHSQEGAGTTFSVTFPYLFPEDLNP
jgi:signal transduction histidine kinase